MAWVKVPDEHRPLFQAALPNDARVQTMPMFGGLAAKVNGHIFGGLFGRSAIVRLSPADEPEALALEGAGWFAPMGDGRVSKTSIMLPESMMDEPAELKAWLRRAFDHAVTQPPKKTTKSAANKPAVNKSAANKPAANTPVSRRASSRRSPSRARSRSA